MQRAKLLLSCALVGVFVAVTYFVFEAVVRNSIHYLWDTVFDTENARLMVIPLCLSLSLLFFGLQHYLDPKSEHHESHGLGGEAFTPSLKTIGVILLLGFFSLVAGASLGPEAVLVPASMVIGSYVGVKLFRKDQHAVKALAAAGIMALMAAFFHSFLVGVLSVLLVTKQAKIKVTPPLLLVSVVASASAYFTLRVIDPSNSYFHFPPFSWKVAIIDIVAGVFLVVAGYGTTFALKYLHNFVRLVRIRSNSNTWWKLAIFASVGLSGLYLLGGTLVEFTGNESIMPLISRATSLGALGVFGVLIIKLCVIAWSKAMGYRGGLVFPMIFVASSLTVLSQFAFKDASFGTGLIAALVGILAAERKAKILF